MRGQPNDFPDLFGLPDALRQAAADAGFRSVWVRPVTSRRGLRGALVVWRRLAGVMSSDQEQRIAAAVSLVAVAFDHADVNAADLAAWGSGPQRYRRATDPDRPVDSPPAMLDVNGAVLAVNVEGLDRVVSEFGSAAAEAVMILAGARLAATVRAVDEIVDRGSNISAAVCRPPVDRVAVISIANRIVQVLSSPYFVGGPDSGGLARRVEQVTVNVGIAFQTEPTDLDEVIERAEDAMRVAASEGSNEWRIAVGSRRPPSRSELQPPLPN